MFANIKNTTIFARKLLLKTTKTFRIMSEIDGKDLEVALSPRELYEKYKGFDVITEYGGHGVIVGYSEDNWYGEYELIASVAIDEGWDWLDGGDTIPDYKGSEDDRAFLYVKEEGIVK